MANESVYEMLLQEAKIRHRRSIRWFIGCNAPSISLGFFKEGWDVLLGASMTEQLVDDKHMNFFFCDLLQLNCLEMFSVYVYCCRRHFK